MRIINYVALVSLLPMFCVLLIVCKTDIQVYKPNGTFLADDDNYIRLRKMYSRNGLQGPLLGLSGSRDLCSLLSKVCIHFRLYIQTTTSFVKIVSVHNKLTSNINQYAAEQLRRYGSFDLHRVLQFITNRKRGEISYKMYVSNLGRDLEMVKKPFSDLFERHCDKGLSKLVFTSWITARMFLAGVGAQLLLL